MQSVYIGNFDLSAAFPRSLLQTEDMTCLVDNGRQEAMCIGADSDDRALQDPSVIYCSQDRRQRGFDASKQQNRRTGMVQDT